MKQSKIDKDRAYLTSQGYTERRIKNVLTKLEAEEQTQRNQKPVKEIVITIEWKRSSTWGNNPNAEVEINYSDGTYGHNSGYTCSGCGYDKESTVISQIFNDCLRYKLWEMEEKDVSGHPYGISFDFDYTPYFCGGVGTTCYYSISEYIGGTFHHTSSGKTFDVYTFTMN